MNRAFGKVILMGEHAVVYGQPAIALPLKAMQVTTIIESSNQLEIDTFYFKGELSKAPDNLNNLKAVIRRTLEALEKSNETFRLIIKSNIPAERGVGSSAAVANSIVKAIFNFYEKSLSSDLLFELAQVSEKIAHGNPSGLDTLVTVADYPLYYIRGQKIESFKINCSAYLVVADSGLKGETKLAVGELAKLKETNPEFVNDAIIKLGKLTQLSKDYLVKNNSLQLGKVMSQAHQILKALSISNHSLDNLVVTALDAGALGAKLTGGGKGGCIIALANNEAEAKHISKALQASGALETWIMELSNG